MLNIQCEAQKIQPIEIFFQKNFLISIQNIINMSLCSKSKCNILNSNYQSSY